MCGLHAARAHMRLNIVIDIFDILWTCKTAAILLVLNTKCEILAKYCISYAYVLALIM